MKQTKLVCPVCGASIAIPEHEHFAAGMVIGKDSGLGTVELPLASKEKKSKSRKEALEASGIDTSKFFALLNTSSDKDFVAKIELFFQSEDNDDTMPSKVASGPSVVARHLAKQHVLAQMFRVIDAENRGGLSYHNWIKDHGYDYTWKMLIDELERQASMWKHGDVKCYNEDNRWFNREVAIKMAIDYKYQLEKFIGTLRTHKFEGKPYYKLYVPSTLLRMPYNLNKGILTKDIPTLLTAVSSRIDSIRLAKSPATLLSAVTRFYIDTPRLTSPDNRHFQAKQNEEWINAYKGYGSYFAMQNLILHHGCKFELMSKARSIRHLESMADEYKNEAYWLYGSLKHLIDINNIDIKAKREEWRKAKMSK